MRHPDDRNAFERLMRQAAHDLREPLRMVQGYTDLLQRRYGRALDADGQQFLAFAHDGALRMGRVLDDLVAYVEAWSRPPALGPCDAGACAAAALESLPAAAEEADVQIAPLPRLHADPAKLTLLFRHLLDNALKFRSDARPRIRVAAQREGARWHFVVEDNGMGIDERFRDEVFEPFRRLHGVGAFTGSGLGLATAREIVASHDGRIWAEGAPGGGCQIHFTLPADATAQPAEGGSAP